MTELTGAVGVPIVASEEPVTLAQAKAHCRVDFDDDDEYLTHLIKAARRWAEGFLGATLTDTEVGEDIQQGILLVIGHLYANREAVTVGQPATKVPMTAEALLWPGREVNL